MQIHLTTFIETRLSTEFNEFYSLFHWSYNLWKREKLTDAMKEIWKYKEYNVINIIKIHTYYIYN